MDEDESQENSQTEEGADETRRQAELSQTPPLRSQAGSDADDDQEEDREEQTTGSLWGHARLPHSVYGNNPPAGGKRMSKQNAVWEVVKHLKEKTADGVVVDAKYTHVCVSTITAAEAGEVGADVDSDGNSLCFCNKLFSLSKTKNCYRSSQATKHCAHFHGETSAAGKALAQRATKNNAHKRDVMEASSHKAGQHKAAQHTSGLRSGAAAQYTITNQELCLGKVARWSVNAVPAAVFIPLHCACCALTYHNTVNFRVTYTPCKISQVELNSPYLRDVFMQYWASGNPDPKCPFLSIYLYKLYLAAEFAVCLPFICP